MFDPDPISSPIDPETLKEKPRTSPQVCHDNEATAPGAIDPTRPPRTADALREWIRAHLGLHVADHALIPGHQSPMDYLAHVFFGDALDPVDGIAPDLTDAGPNPPPHDTVVWANRGGGKTFMGALATALDLLFKPGIQVRILAGSVEQGQRMHGYLRGFFERPNLSGFLDGRITERRIRLESGSCAEVLAPTQASVRGSRIHRIRCDEVELFEPALWDAVQLTTHAARLGPWQIRGTIECLSTMHLSHGPMSRLVQEAREGKRSLFCWGVLDALAPCPPARPCARCPLEPDCAGRAKHARGHIQIDDAIVQKGRVSLDVWRAEMLCERPSRSHAVYPEFDPERHTFEADPPEPSPSLAWVCGMDFGFRAPTVILWGAVDAAGVLSIYDERIQSETILAAHIASITDPARPRPAWLGVDPAGLQRSEQTGKNAIDLLAEAGLEARFVRTSIDAGIRLIHARLRPAAGSPRLRVHRRCRGLIRALETYHYPAAQPESTEPVKDGPDHAADALRYLVSVLDNPHRWVQDSYVGGGRC